MIVMGLNYQTIVSILQWNENHAICIFLNPFAWSGRDVTHNCQS